MRFDETASRLIALIYDAALDPRIWPVFLKEFAEEVGASGSALLHHHLADQQGSVAAAFRVDPEALQKYNAHFGAIDPWMQHGQARGLITTGSVLIDEEMVSRHEFVKTEYYSDLAAPYQLTRCLAAVIHRSANITASISAVGGDSRQPFGESERRLLRILIPHLQRALQVHRRIVGLDLLNQAAADVFDRLPTGVILARANGTVVFANRVALDILQGCDGLASGVDGLVASIPAESQALQALIFGAASTSAGKGISPGGIIALSRPSLRRPLAALVTPLRHGTRIFFGAPEETALAAVFVSDPERVTQIDPDILRALWGLTPAEATVASLLASGNSVSDISRKLAIRGETVRWHVKRVLAKTETTRQAELVRLLATGPAAVTRR